MRATLRAIYDVFIGVRKVTPDQQRRGRLLARLILISGFFDCVFVVYNFWAWKTFHQESDWITFLMGLAGLLLLSGVWLLNRRGLSYLAAAFTMLLYYARIVMISDPERFIVAFWAFILPIMIASFVLKPAFSFLAAAVSALVYLYATASLGISEGVDILVFKLVILFILALLTFLTASHLDRAIDTAQQSEAKYRNLFHDLPIGLYRTTPQGDILDANAAFLEMFGFANLESLQGVKARDLYADPRSREEFLSSIEGTRIPEMRMRRSDGTLFWVTDHVRPVHDASGNVVCYEGSLIDLTARKRAEQKLEILAVTDPLTGISNRRHFFDQAELALQGCRPDGKLALLMIDLDHFKNTNDRYGHAVGDAVLREAVQRIRSGLRTGDLCGRYGGEEFTVLLPVSGRDEAGQVADRIWRSLRAAPVSVDGQAVLVTISMGVAIRDSSAEPLDELLQRADQALYAAKQSGRDRWMLWSPAMKISL